jgi:hypothetical protein
VRPVFAVFAVYLLVICVGIVVYTLVGATHG